MRYIRIINGTSDRSAAFSRQARCNAPGKLTHGHHSLVARFPSHTAGVYPGVDERISALRCEVVQCAVADPAVQPPGEEQVPSGGVRAQEHLHVVSHHSVIEQPWPPAAGQWHLDYPRSCGMEEDFAR